jgi:cyclic pyranopterin phosphate synthase
LRVSVTDRCNLRCSYCLPEGSQVWLPKADIATLEELASLVRTMTLVGTTKVRITGGEPLLRRDLPTLVSELAGIPAIQDLSMTSNAVLLPSSARQLRSAGLGRLTISIDTLQASRYAINTLRDSHAELLAGILAAEEAGFTPLKLNTVVVRGTNDDELAEILRFARERGHQVRFIEYMDVGGALNWDPELVVSQQEILQRLESEWSPIKALATGDSAPANLFTLPDGTVFGIIASVTAPFCGACDRARLTADGKLFTCLYAADGLDLLGPLRAGATHEELATLIDGRWRNRDDHGAEDRLELTDRGPSAQAAELRAKPHLGMHTKGG